MKYTNYAAMSALFYIVSVGIMSAFSVSISADMKKVGSRFPDITNNQITWIASLPNVTAVFGSLFSGYMSLKFGRKAVLMCVSVPFLISWLIIAYATIIPWIYVGRLLSGFCAGICSVAVPAYIIEITSIEMRGLLGSCYQVSYAIGVLIAISFRIVFSWPWIAIIGAFFILSASSLMVFMPESPVWLVITGEKEQTIASIYFLKGKDINTDLEYNKLLDQVGEKQQKSVVFHEFKEPELYKPIALSVALVFFQQFSGVSALMSYTVQIFEHAESSVDPPIAAAIVAGVQVVSAIIGSAFIDKIGRPTLYTISGIFVTLGLLILGIDGILGEFGTFSSDINGWISLIGFIIFVASFSLGYGPIPYLMTPEFVPIHSRSAVLAIASVFSYIFSFIVTKTFIDLSYFAKDYGVFWIYGLFSILGCLFCLLCLPETKGKLIKEIQHSFQFQNNTPTDQEAPRYIINMN